MRRGGIAIFRVKKLTNSQTKDKKMVSLPLSHTHSHSGASARSTLASFGIAVVDFFELLGASARVSQAMESRRAPRTADLRILGIEGPLPRLR